MGLHSILHTATSAVGSAGTNPVSEESYSIWPTIALDETTSILHTVLSLQPRVYFLSAHERLNAADQNGAINVQYRLSPHLTLSGRDSFQKSSSVFNQPDWGAGDRVGRGTGNEFFGDCADCGTSYQRLGTSVSTYQFAANGMVGASGTFTNLHYPNPSQVPGLGDSSIRRERHFSIRSVLRECITSA